MIRFLNTRHCGSRIAYKEICICCLCHVISVQVDGKGGKQQEGVQWQWKISKENGGEMTANIPSVSSDDDNNMCQRSITGEPFSNRKPREQRVGC